MILKTVEYEDSPDTVTVTSPLSHDLVALQLYGPPSDTDLIL